MHTLGAFGVGLVFGIGLLISGMTDPSKIIGFLDLAGAGKRKRSPVLPQEEREIETLECQRVFPAECHTGGEFERVEPVPGRAGRFETERLEKLRGVFVGQLFAPGAGAAAFGLVYGFLAGQKGMTLLETALTSMLVFAGASQLVALELWGDPLPFLSLVAAVLVINLRHVLMGPTLLPWLRPLPPGKAYGSLFFMTDEVWGVSVAELRRGGRDAAFLLGAGATLYGVWVASTVLGRAAGDLSAIVRDYGLDYLTTAFFVAREPFERKTAYDASFEATVDGVAVSFVWRFQTIP